MAEIEIDLNRLTAGKEYCTVLERAGLDLRAALWGYDKDEEQFVLIIVTDFFELMGPLEISRKLFQAYNASVTPREIDPFTVRLHGAKQPYVDELLRYVSEGFIQKLDPVTRKPVGEKVEITGGSVGNIQVHRDWVIKGDVKRRRDRVELGRRWRRFAESIDRLAA